MRVSRTQAEENRQKVINVASRLFRTHGFDGIGLKDLMEGAGLTEGVFYKQFASKEDLIRQASGRALEKGALRCQAATAEKPGDPLGAIIAFYLSKEHCDNTADGCPIVALGSDAARQSPEARASFEEGIRAHLDVLGSLLPGPDGEKPSACAMAMLSIMVGAPTLSRVVNNPDLSQSFLDTAIEQVRDIAAA